MNKTIGIMHKKQSIAKHIKNDKIDCDIINSCSSNIQIK